MSRSVPPDPGGDEGHDDRKAEPDDRSDTNLCAIWAAAQRRGDGSDGAAGPAGAGAGEEVTLPAPREVVHGEDVGDGSGIGWTADV